jgi:hypothetical protein
VSQTLSDVGSIVAVALAAGSVGWWGRAAVDDWRMRRMLTRINERVSDAERKMAA